MLCVSGTWPRLCLRLWLVIDLQLWERSVVTGTEFRWFSVAALSQVAAFLCISESCCRNAGVLLQQGDSCGWELNICACVMAPSVILSWTGTVQQTSRCLREASNAAPDFWGRFLQRESKCSWYMSLYRIQWCQVDVCVAGRQVLPPHFVDFCHL